MIESSGLVSRRDLSEAYKFFDLPADGGGADDDRIYNIFHAQQQDYGTQAQEKAREMLGRIGKHRGSKILTNAALQTIETVEEAYAWLGNGLGPEADDSFVVTVFTIKVSHSSTKKMEQASRLPKRVFLPCRGIERAALSLSPLAMTTKSKFCRTRLTTFLPHRRMATKTWKKLGARQYR